ncbi:hypothetical protein MUO14_10130 [Halobacillus shinanisalinarum]|uniref:DUF6933 domain-containing protein n=1 Tax=Halobacillus shinanisalinarum TaxID=2932258 RepID=A0ABY4H461_9BACI|nr:hypothetical protein [Halobacillus shinanisalinarum]UOQ95248.1 hypothetical protein MUO14_10130 [Halobacillus shinanisalinarum]
MFVIGATQKLAKELHQELEEQEQYKDIPKIYQWHANIITVNRRKCLMLMNNGTGLNLTLFGLRKQQFENIENVIKGSLNQLFQLLKVDKGISDHMLEAASEFVFTKTTNRQTLGMMNQVKALVEDAADGLEYEAIDAEEINYITNAELIYGPLKYSTPVETLKNYFEK